MDHEMTPEIQIQQLPTEPPDSSNRDRDRDLANMHSQCWRFAQALYPSSVLREAPTQGYCSYTLQLDHDAIIQFRPWRHRLDLELISAVRDTFGELAPVTQLLGTVHIRRSASRDQEAEEQDDDDNPGSLLVYALSRIPGTPLSTFLHHQLPSRAQLEPLIRSFARLYATAWTSALPASSPLLPALKRRIGLSLRWRLEQMHAHLPARFRGTVGQLLAALGEVEALPWALTHGDLVPTNIMVDRAGEDGSFQLKGLIDWAEAEYLPFGVGLYGLEELLGFASGGKGEEDGGGKNARYPPLGSTFAYFACAEELRAIFWEELGAAVPELVTDLALRATVEHARLLGLLLWYAARLMIYTCSSFLPVNKS
jgi:hypothetical protein